MVRQVTYELEAVDIEATEISDDHFGGNILISRDDVSEDGSYPELVEELGANSIRYPGGAVTEMYFDVTDPNASSGINPETGETEKLIPFDEFMGFAEEEGLSTLIVLPTINLLSEDTDHNGDRFAQIDEDAYRQFVRDTLEGEYGNPEIKGFEIGNEYWGSGRMSAVEYGRIASKLSVIVEEEIQAAAAENPSLAEVDILVQMGTNFNYSKLEEEYSEFDSGAEILAELSQDYGVVFSEDKFLTSGGDVKWTHVSNQLIISEFDTDEERDAVDAVVAHLYSKEPVVSGTRDYPLKVIENTWQEELPDSEIWVTEWNQKSTKTTFDPQEDYGLKQAHELLYMIDEMMEHDVEAAYVWPLLQNTKNALSVGHEHDELSVPGEMFAMMSESLPGKRNIGLKDPTSEEDKVVDVSAYYGDNELVFFVMSKVDEPTSTELDIEMLLAEFGSIEAQVLGVAEGENPGDTRSEAEVEDLDAADVYDEGYLLAHLDAHEVLQVVFSDVELTPHMTEVLEDNEIIWDDDEPFPGEDDDPIGGGTPPNEDGDPEEEEEEEVVLDDDGGGFGGLAFLLPLLLLLAAMGMG